MRNTASRLSPCEELLLACTDLRSDGPANERIHAALSGSQLDWPDVVRHSIRHGVAGHLAWHFRRFPDDSRIPPQMRAILERIYAAQGRRNNAMFRAAGDLVRALEKSGISGLVLKGVGLAQTVYPNHALRSFADIDLLVPAERWEEAGAIAEREGFLLERKTTAPLDYHLPYVRIVADDILSECLASEFDETHTLESLGGAIHRIVVEIHRSAFTLPGGFAREADNALLWENSRAVALPDSTIIQIPGPEAMIVHLATHTARHRYNRLMFMGDMVQTVRTWESEIDWVRLVQLVKLYGAQNSVWRMLDLAQRESDVVVPADILSALEPGPTAGPDGLPLEVSNIFLGMELMIKTPSAITLKQLRSERSLRQVFISVTNILFPSPSIIGRYYRVKSPILIAGCYVIRPFQLLGRFIGVVFRTAIVERSRRRVAGENHQTD